MGQHMLTPPAREYVDKRRGANNDGDSHLAGATVFTANGAGTTTTIVGADATLATGVNVVRVGDQGKILTSAGVDRGTEKVVTVTSVASAAGTTTVTFTPALSVATASGDVFRLTGTRALPNDNDTLDARLNQFSSTTYTQAVLDAMTQNDKIYALRLIDDPTGV